MTYAVIMAGGVGSRFWPMSRKDHPKQFIEVFKNHTLIQNTVARLQGFIPPEQCFIVTNERYVEQTREQLPAIPVENILAEPIARNTAPCIAYAAHRLRMLDPEAIMIVLPADHIIQNVKRFHEVLQHGVQAAGREGALVTIGIEPSFPATGYGYIQFEGAVDHETDDVKVYPVKTFAEKPDIETACRFIDSGDFLWNSGMFIWQVDSVLDAIGEHLPDVAEAFSTMEENIDTKNETSAIRQAYEDCPNISIDYGVMERSGNVFVVPGDFDWNDVGDWKAVYDLREKNSSGNVILGNVIVEDAQNCMVQANDRLIVLVGMDHTIVVDTGDVTLICHQDHTQQVKQVVDYLNSERLDQYI